MFGGGGFGGTKPTPTFGAPTPQTGAGTTGFNPNPGAGGTFSAGAASLGTSTFGAPQAAATVGATPTGNFTLGGLNSGTPGATSSFGAPASGNSQFGGFGQQTAPAPAAGTFAFGSNNTAASTGGARPGFATTGAQPSTSFAFGAPAATTGGFGSAAAPSTGGFGGQASTPGFGSGNFGVASQAPQLGQGSGMFGQTANTTAATQAPPPPVNMDQQLQAAILSVQDPGTLIRDLPPNLKSALEAYQGWLVKKTDIVREVQKNCERPSLDYLEDLSMLDMALEGIEVETVRLVQSMLQMDVVVKKENAFASDAERMLQEQALARYRQSSALELPAPKLIAKADGFRQRIQQILEACAQLEDELDTSDSSGRVSLASLREALTVQQNCLVAIAADAAKLGEAVEAQKVDFLKVYQEAVGDGRDPFRRRTEQRRLESSHAMYNSTLPQMPFSAPAQSSANNQTLGGPAMTFGQKGSFSQGTSLFG